MLFELVIALLSLIILFCACQARLLGTLKDSYLKGVKYDKYRDPHPVKWTSVLTQHLTLPPSKMGEPVEFIDMIDMRTGWTVLRTLHMLKRMLHHQVIDGDK